MGLTAVFAVGFHPFCLFKLFNESMLFFTVDSQFLFLAAVLELGTQGIGCC